MSKCNRVVNINSAGAAIISDNPTEDATGTLKVHRCSSAGNTCLTISHANNTKFSYIQLENDNNSQQYHLGIGNTAATSTQLRGKHYIFSYPLNKTLMQMDSVGRVKFQTCVGDGGTGNATWDTDTSGVQIIGPCNSNYARLGITAVNCNDSCATVNSIYIGTWDNSYSRIESSGCPMLITSYDGGIGLGNDGTSELCIGTLGDVIIKPTTAKNVDPLGTLCLDITGSINPQNGGIVMNSTSQTHIRFLSSGNMCWQWRHWNPTTEDKFSAYSWKRSCDMFNIQGSDTYFGNFGHITSCAPLYVTNTLDPYFINTGGNKCLNFYWYGVPGCSCFAQTNLMARYDSSFTNVCYVTPNLTLYNGSETEGTSSTLFFAGKEASGGNSVGLAYISGRKEGSASGNWGCGSLQFLVNCASAQCWAMCMTHCAGVCAINCVMSPLNCGTLTCACVYKGCTTGAGGATQLLLERRNGADNHYLNVVVNADTNLVTLCSTGSNGGGFCMWCYVDTVCSISDLSCASTCVKSPILCATTQVTAPQGYFSSATIPLAIVDPGVTAYYWCFPNNDTVSFHPNTTSTKTLYFCNAGTGVMNVCVEGCVRTPLICGATCVISPIVCGTSCVISPTVCGTGCVVADGELRVDRICGLNIGADSGQQTTNGGTGSLYQWGYQAGGAWASPFPDLVIGFHTGLQLGALCNHGGTRFYSDHPHSAVAQIIFLVGCGNCNVCACYDLCAGGNIEAQGDVTSASDCRLKSNITYIKDAIGIVNNLCGRIFIKNNKEQIGVIAQEVEKVLPQVVFQGESEDDFKSVSYGNMVGVLIEAIKEQNTRIDNQQEEIDCLKEIIKSK